MTATRDLAVRLSAPTNDINGHGQRSLHLIHSLPGETLAENHRNQQANHLIGGVRRFLFHRPEYRLIGTDGEMVAFARQTGGFGNVWVEPILR